jgi:two-component system, NtrC family, nitrogen regulation response regulator GlnG
MENLKSEIINVIGFIPSASRFKFAYHIYDKTIIEHALSLSRGNQIQAARMVGINRNTLRKKIKVYEIYYKKYRST